MKTGVEKIKVVLDTNVLISGLNFEGNENRILTLFYRRMIEVYFSSFILQELKIVLEKKFRWEKDRVNFLLEKINDLGIIVNPTCSISVIKTKKNDNRILECAVEAGVDYLITGNTKHLQPLNKIEGIPILTPTEFLNIIDF